MKKKDIKDEDIKDCFMCIHREVYGPPDDPSVSCVNPDPDARSNFHFGGRFCAYYCPHYKEWKPPKGFTTTNFIDDCLSGVAFAKNVEDYIEYWHTHQTGKPLHDYLGMTEDEYGQWLRTGADKYLWSLIDSRRRKK